MTSFDMLTSLAGLSQREAGQMLEISGSSIDKMARGTRSTPAGVIAELRRLIAMQHAVADQEIAEISRLAPPKVELGFPADDHEAQTLGWPCVGAWRAMAARVIAGCGRPVILVPRGSTPATAGAADAHDK